MNSENNKLKEPVAYLAHMINVELNIVWLLA